MQFAEPLLKCFFPAYSLTSVTESDITLSSSISADVFTPSDDSAISQALSFLSLRDNLIFSIEFGDADPISLYSSALNLSGFIQDLSNEYQHQQGEPIKATLTIHKKRVDFTISIYDLLAFVNSLSSLNVAQAFTVFNRAFNAENSLLFEVHGLDKAFCTSTIHFCPVGFSATAAEVDRNKNVEDLRTTSFFASIEQHKLSPADFRLIQFNYSHTQIIKLFNHYCTVLSIIYLFDITTLTGNNLDFKLNGYKSIKGTADLSIFPLPGTNDYYNIWRWVYSGGNLNDKIGLARNIISLHFQKAGELALKGNSFQSIQSSYKVYEKQNIKQYIEIRNKISDQLLDFNNRANKIIETFASGFQKSSLAIITFYTSAIVLKVLGKGEFIHVFTLDATILSLAFLLGSFFYFLIARWEVKVQKTRFIASYNNLKERYTDLLDAEDVKRILNNDKEFNADKKFISDKLKKYSFLWLIFLGLLLITTLLLYFIYNIDQLFETPLWKYFFATPHS